MRLLHFVRRLFQRDPTPQRRVVLYTRKGCHLCDDAKVVLRRYLRRNEQIEEIDIDERTEFLADHHEWIPVVEIDGVIRFRGQINEVLLKRLLEH
ncbi:MAG: glutaredoxin family protein [Planctomycetota bacterium]